MSYEIEEVNSSRLEKIFLRLPHYIYPGDSAWVCPLEEEIQGIFNPKKNSFFSHGKAKRWVLKDTWGTYIGRIAAFINEKKAYNYPTPVGGVGFFECIDNQEAANLLFDTAKDWLDRYGIQAMDGPINFGENDRYWGLLVEGFTQTVYGMQYNPPYYRNLFETYGFQLLYEQESNLLDLNKPIPDRFARIAEWVNGKEGVEFKHADPKHPILFARAMQEIYNDAWQHHENFTPMTDTQIQGFIKEFKPIVIDIFLPYAVVKGEPAAFIVCMPDLNQIFKPLKGKFPLWRKLQFLWRSRNRFEWYRKRGILTGGRVLIMGAKQKFQRYGLEAGMIMSSKEDSRKLGFKHLQLSWVGDFNPKMQSLHKATGADRIHLHYTYRYLFDPKAPLIKPKTLG